MDSLATFFDQQIRRHGSRETARHRPRYRTIRWSFEVLGERAKGLAQALAAKGVGPGDRVALCAEIRRTGLQHSSLFLLGAPW